MRLIPGAAIAGLILAIAGAAQAQVGAIKLSSEEATYGDRFFEQPAAQVGLVVRNACTIERSLAGRVSYLVKTGVIYWGLNAECVRVVVNHRATEDMSKPTYL